MEKKAYQSLRKQTDFVPKVGIILGSGLGDLADDIDIVKIVNYSDIEGFPRSTVKGHKGRFVFGHMHGVPVAVMQGRVHFYEGYTMEQVVLPVRLMKLMGIETLLLTNAAGGINESFHVGTFMAINDHIRMAADPLIGKNKDEFGTRFPDMSFPYDKELLNLLKKSAKETKIELREGVYYQVTGPSFETAAEIRMMRVVGADAVGMSTAVETVAARHAGIKVAGISVISDMAAGITDAEITHEDVLSALKRVSPDFKNLVFQFMKNVGFHLKLKT